MSEIKWTVKTNSPGIHCVENESCVAAAVLPNPVGGFTAQAYGGALDCSSVDVGGDLEKAKAVAVELAKWHAAESVKILLARVENIRKAWGV